MQGGSHDPSRTIETSVLLNDLKGIGVVGVVVGIVGVYHKYSRID
jgi:hypothetical protein